MNSFKLIVLVLACAVGFACARTAAPASEQAKVPVRKFEFTYVTRIPAVPTDAKMIRMWIPLPQSDHYQAISGLKIESPFPYVKHHEPEYGNEYLYLEVPAVRLHTPAEIRFRFQAVRHEHRAALDLRAAGSTSSNGDPPSLKRFLLPDRRVPLDGVIAELSQQETRGIQDPLEKARAIYNYVINTMRYDKSGTGWGNGDAIWACTAKRGNCTDFHSLFIGMMRAAGIPARFEIGFPLPPDQDAATIPGYHCWAEFYVARYGWIPVDASEAWKHPDKKDYFFGAHDDNRVQLSVGRDIRLYPAQQGDPLNYFIYPYAELDGKPLALQSAFSFRDRLNSSD